MFVSFKRGGPRNVKMRLMKPLLVFSLVALFVVAPLHPAGKQSPRSGKIRVAFVMTEGATMIDFAGPWEVFQDVHIEGRGSTHDEMMPFELFTVGESRKPIRTTGGMVVTPDYSFDDAPQPHIVVIGAQRGSKKLPDWLRKVAPKADVVMSVCTGAFKLADSGLLDGKQATTHHDFYSSFQQRYPKVKLVRSTRFVQSDDKLYTAGGLTSGIDLALHVVEAYFGREVAQRTADYMEHESSSWKR